jgi:ubiquinone/menaquinone biosynthesis C-methylase UbiE
MHQDNLINYQTDCISKEFDTVSRKINFLIYKATLYDLLMGFWERKSNHDLTTNSLCSQAKKICELGVGTGHLLSLLVKKYPQSKFFGYDINKRMLNVARDYLSRKKLLSENITLDIQDCRKVMIDDNSFDLIFSSYLLDLLPSADIRQTLREINRMLKKGGTASLLTLTNDIHSNLGFFGRLTDHYFKFTNNLYTKIYRNLKVKRLSQKLFYGYFTHCRPINLKDHLSSINSLSIVKQNRTSIRILGIPILAARYITIQKI